MKLDYAAILRRRMEQEAPEHKPLSYIDEYNRRGLAEFYVRWGRHKARHDAFDSRAGSASEEVQGKHRVPAGSPARRFIDRFLAFSHRAACTCAMLERY